MSFFQTEVVISVYNPWTMEVIPYASISLFNMATGESIVGSTDSLGVFVATVTSGLYSLIVNASGFREYSNIYGIGGTIQEIGVPLIPTTGTPPPIPPTEVDLAVHVKDAYNVPLAGAAVSVGDYIGLTNAYGIIIFRGLPIAVFNWIVSLQGYNNSNGVVDTSKIVDLYVVLTPITEPPPPPVVEHTLTVRVLDNSGNPVPNIRVTAVRIEGGYSSAGPTNISGMIIFTNAITGNYRITVLSRGDVTYDQREVLVDRDLTIEMNVPLIWSLKISSNFGGSTDPRNGEHFIENGLVVPVKAIPIPLLYKFDGWTLNGSTTQENPVNITMIQDYILNGTFSPSEFPDIQKILTIVGVGLIGLIVLTSRRK